MACYMYMLEAFLGYQRKSGESEMSQDTRPGISKPIHSTNSYFDDKKKKQTNKMTVQNSFVSFEVDMKGGQKMHTKISVNILRNLCEISAKFWKKANGTIQCEVTMLLFINPRELNVYANVCET